MFISPVYHPNDFDDQIMFTHYLSSINTIILRNCFLISGQDMNRNIGTKSNKCISIGPHGLDHVNEEDLEVIDILRSHKLKTSLT